MPASLAAHLRFSQQLALQRLQPVRWEFCARNDDFTPTEYTRIHGERSWPESDDREEHHQAENHSGLRIPHVRCGYRNQGKSQPNGSQPHQCSGDRRQKANQKQGAGCESQQTSRPYCGGRVGLFKVESALNEHGYTEHSSQQE
jgi:hypothetical protein